MIESKHEMTESKEDIEDRTPEGHDPNDERGGDGTRGEAGAMPGVPASERAKREGPRSEGRGPPRPGRRRARQQERLNGHRHQPAGPHDSYPI